MVFFILVIVGIILISNHRPSNLSSGYTHESIYDRAKNAKTADEYWKLTKPIDEYNKMTGNDIWK